MERIHQLSKRYGFKILEDASHAIGGKYQNHHIGNCKYSDITVFSFHPVKIITTGEGGMALSNNKELSAKMKLLRSHGITRDEVLMTHKTDGPWYYQQISIGFNYRMTDIQAALGISQMKRIDGFIKKRQEIASAYDRELRDFPLILPKKNRDNFPSWHLYVVRINSDETNANHKTVFEFLRRHNILVNLHYIPVHTQPFYAKQGFHIGDYPSAESYYNEAISLPIFPLLLKSDQDRVVSILKEALYQ